MNNFPTYGNYFIQFWMMPTMISPQGTLLTPMSFSPQLTPQEFGNFVINYPLLDSTSAMQQQNEKGEEENEPKLVADDITMKSDN